MIQQAWQGNATLCLRGRSTEAVYNLAQYGQLTVAQLKVQLSEFLQSRGLVRSGHVDATAQTPTPLLAIIRVSQVCQGQESCKSKWEGRIAVNGTHSCQQPLTYF